MITIVKCFCLGLFMAAYSAASNSATLIVNNGVLMGAAGVDVNGVLYDVSFLDGTCIELYNGCDENTDFPFTNPANLNDGVLLGVAMQALLDQVFIDSPVGAFDSQPDLMNGCNVPGGCSVFTPLWANVGANSAGVFSAFNSDQEFRDDVGSGGGSRTFDTRPVPGVVEDISVYAVWNGAAVVPIPSAIWLFGSGLLGFIGLSNRKKKPNK